MTKVELETRELLRRFETRGINMTFDQANTLRRAERTLHRWAELECGDGNNYASWSIERDEETEIPYIVTYPHEGKTYRRKIADRERGAQRRIDAIAKALGFFVYYQGDPRGCALYIDSKPFEAFNYTNGIAVCL